MASVHALANPARFPTLSRSVIFSHVLDPRRVDRDGVKAWPFVFAVYGPTLGASLTTAYRAIHRAGEDIAPGTAIRLGGMVARGSVRKLADGVNTTFTVTDNAAATPVTYRGIVPDLFREGSGVVTEGVFGARGLFVATNILAKHDERYVPPQMAGKMHKTETLDK